ncbi:MAG: 8-oxo-dGTP diphosphatase MutT [Parvibaculales bacterium]
MKQVLVVACALVNEQGKVLVTQRPAGKSMAGKWEFPGGKIEAGETPENALIRELKEELDIDVTAACLAPLSFASHSYADFHLLMPVFICRKWQGEPRSVEGQNLQWVKPVALFKLDMPPADLPLIGILNELV